MNIVTTTMPDAWVDTHLRRWRWLIHCHMPKARCFLIIVRNQFNRDQVDAVLAKVKPRFASIAVVDEQPTPGCMVSNDLLRAMAIDIFALKDVLYIDADIDVVQSIERVPELSAEDLLWTFASERHGYILSALRAFSLPVAEPDVEPGVLFMRKSCAKAYVDIANSGKIAMGVMNPSVAIWNVLVRLHTSTCKLPYSYNVPYAAFERTYEVHMAHFGGPTAKSCRPFYHFEHGFARRSYIRACDADGLDWGPEWHSTRWRSM